MSSKVEATLREAALPTSDAMVAAIYREWDRLAGPGTVFTGAERVAIAAAARSGTASNVVELASVWVSRDAGGMQASHVRDLEARGLSRTHLTEIIAVVSRLSAIDHYCLGIGAPLLDLPTPFRGEPSGNVAPGAKLGAAWIPTVPGPIGAPTILNALPEERHAVFDLHAELYLSEREMVANSFDSLLTRCEMEMIAARTSYLNECFY